MVSNTPAPRNCARIDGRKKAMAVYSNEMQTFITPVTIVRSRYGFWNSTRKLTFGGAFFSTSGCSGLASWARMP